MVHDKKYGKATVDLTYNPEPGVPNPTLSQIFNTITASYSNDFTNIPTASYDTASSGRPLRHYVNLDSAGISTMMHVSSSINLFGKIIEPLESQTTNIITKYDAEDPTNQERWVISTKYECPVLNFNHYTDDTKARGMWNGYGNIPNYSAEGIKIKLREWKYMNIIYSQLRTHF